MKHAFIADRHTRELFHTRDEDEAIDAELQDIRLRIHALKLRKRQNEQLKDSLARETEREWEARS